MNGVVIRKLLVFLLFAFPAAKTQGLTHEWSELIGGSGDSIGRTVVFDAAGNVVIGGDFVGEMQIGPMTWNGNFTLTDGFVAKYSPDGSFLWATHLGSEGDDSVAAVAVDGTGNVVAAGQLDGDVMVALLSAQDGTVVWQKRFGNNLNSEALGVAVTAQDTIVVGADFQGTVDFGGGGLDSSGSIDIALFAYDMSGNHLWSRRFGGSGTEEIGDLTVSGDKVAVAGHFSGGTDIGSGPVSSLLSDIFLAAYAIADGSPVWVKTFRGSGFDGARDVAATADGGFVVAGYFGQSGGSVDFGGGPLEQFGAADAFLARFRADGSFQWARSMGGLGDDYAETVAVARNGNISCAGYFQSTAAMGGADLQSNGAFDAFLAEYDPNGQHRWCKAFGGLVSDRALAVSVDEATVVSGFTLHTIDFGGGRLTTAGFSDAFLARFQPDGSVDDTPLPSSPTVTRTPTPTPVPSAPTATRTTTGTATRTATRTPTRTPILQTATATRTAPDTPPPTATGTATRSATITRTATKTRTPTRTATRTRTATVSRTPTATRTPTKTRTPSPTRTQTPMPTLTRTPTATRTITATRTQTATRTRTRTRTPTRTGTPTRTATGTRTGTPTQSPTRTRTPTPSPTSPPTTTATRTTAPTQTRTPTQEPAPTATHTHVPTATETPTATAAVNETPAESPTPTVAATTAPTATSAVAATATSTPIAVGTRIPVESACAGDCNGDSTVTLDELVQAINVALGLTADATCPPLDIDQDGFVAISEVVKAVGSALEGCTTSAP